VHVSRGAICVAAGVPDSEGDGPALSDHSPPLKSKDYQVVSPGDSKDHQVSRQYMSRAFSRDGGSPVLSPLS
jgi:hypothetical protein